jgi:hypothetical protein
VAATPPLTVSLIFFLTNAGNIANQNMLILPPQPPGGGGGRGPPAKSPRLNAPPCVKYVCNCMREHKIRPLDKETSKHAHKLSQKRWIISLLIMRCTVESIHPIYSSRMKLFIP